MKKLVIGILAHVDAGKTTLSEALLYKSGSIRKPGRVDKGDAFLDTNEMEKERGITIFSKQAVFVYEDMEITLLDTPGHVDFSAEMERTLQVLDYAILVINAQDGVQAHTRTLWRLLARYQIPIFLFINKMDQEGTDREVLLNALNQDLYEGCIDFGIAGTEHFYESIAVSEEKVLEQFLETQTIEKSVINRLIRERKVFPCFFGSALKMEGVDIFLHGILNYTDKPIYPKEFGARVFKIARDFQGHRLTFLKVTGGSLRVKDVIGEKVNQIRIYSGEKYEAVNEAVAGCLCAVTGLLKTFPGEGLGKEQAGSIPILEPVLTYRIILPEEIDAAAMLPKLRLLEEEEPEIHLVWDDTLKEIQIRIMGEVQLEILQRLIKERFDVAVEFGQGSVVYRETIAEPVIGVGHFEPLRHYAQVHLLLEPAEQGSGLQFLSDCSEEVLGKSWQRLVLTHLEEREHRGVLTGAPITDMRITLIAGRAHLKHTEGGDFRQATYRAVRQGLMESTPVLLEPFYSFVLEIPEKSVGRAMTDVERMSGRLQLPQIEEGKAILTGYAPVTAMRGYQKEVMAYTQGEGRLSCTLQGYYPCHNTEEVLEISSYDPEKDLDNPASSVFCAHGAGFVVPWYEVKDYMHLEHNKERLPEALDEGGGLRISKRQKNVPTSEVVLAAEEVDRILHQAHHANKRDENNLRKGVYRRGPVKKREIPPVIHRAKPQPKKEEYLLVDGYNIVFAWEELNEISKVSMDGARGRLLDILCDYQAIKGCNLIVVFDAYRVPGDKARIQDYHNIHLVFTKEKETADQYIEKFAHKFGRMYQVTVATSDSLEQIIIRGQGCGLLSARDLYEDVMRTKRLLREDYLENLQDRGNKRYLLDDFNKEES